MVLSTICSDLETACRVWVVVTSVEPLRAYLFKGGVLPFGTLKEETCDAMTRSTSGEIAAALQKIPCSEIIQC